MKRSLFLGALLLLISTVILELQAQSVYKDQFAHTFSIVARDQNTGEMGVAVQSHWFSVGSIVSWGKSGVGVVATQSFVNPAFGPDGLKMMENGNDAKKTLMTLIEKDEGRDVRQVAMLDVNGTVSAFTGQKCIASARHLSGENYSVQANMMLNDQVVPAMARAFEENSDLPLAERMLAVLWAAQKAGGDIRGQQSAALIVVGAKPVAHSWQDKKIDLRVDDHKAPIKELQRLLKVHRAYDHLNRGDLAMEKNDMALALKEYAAAEQMFPDNLEMKYWKAVTLANNKRLEEAIPIFKEVFSADPNWRELTKRLPDSGLFNISSAELKQVLSL